MNSKSERKARKEAEWAVEQEKLDAERRRKEELPMYNRIEESDASSDVKDILHRLAEFVKFEPYHSWRTR